MLQLRDYQRQAVDSIFHYWSEKPGSPLIVIPTAGGKSLILATLIKELLDDYPNLRILCATHVKELLVQNMTELLNLWPFAPCGLFSAGLGRRDSRAQILFGGVQTIANRAGEIGHVDVVLIDECHLVPRNSETQYGKLFNGLLTINPHMKRVGVTATPFRMGEGLLTEGDDAMFDEIAYEKPVREMIDAGYLSRPISKGMATSYDLTGVGRLGGDYKQGALQAAVDKNHVTQSAVDEIMSYGRDRKAWLLFCAGVEHAYHMRDEIRSRGISCETVAGETPAAERDKIIADFKAGRIRAVTNNSVLTVGTNIPSIDLLAMCRPTLSASLYLQMIGRGLRLSPGKKDCLVLDFAGVVAKHGPIDAVVPSPPKTGTGDAPIRMCPECNSINHASARKCIECGFEFPVEEKDKITATADNAPVLSTEKPWSKVSQQTFSEHPAKDPAKPNTVKVQYRLGFKAVNQWLCPAHQGYAKKKADSYWREHGGSKPEPVTVVEWLERAGELRATDEIQLDYSRNPKYPDIIGYRVADNDNEPGGAEVAANDNTNWADELDDAIPF